MLHKSNRKGYTARKEYRSVLLIKINFVFISLNNLRNAKFPDQVRENYISVNAH